MDRRDGPGISRSGTWVNWDGFGRPKKGKGQGTSGVFLEHAFFEAPLALVMTPRIMDNFDAHAVGGHSPWVIEAEEC